MVYPLSNRPETLNIDYHYLRRQVGAYLGYGYSQADWDDTQEAEVQDIIDEGVRQYAYPPPLPQGVAGTGTDTSHEWSWLRPFFEVQTVSDQRRYLLPENFDRPLGDIALDSDDDGRSIWIRHYPASRLSVLETRDIGNTTPDFYAIEQVTSDGMSPQRKQLVLHPTPDAAYNLRMEYQAYLLQMTEDRPYPPGGQSHGSGIYASCMAVSELRKIGQQGPWHGKFMERLAADIMRDRRRVPQVLGYNGNLRTEIIGRGTLRKFNGIYMNRVLYNGQEYSG